MTREITYNQIIGSVSEPKNSIALLETLILNATSQSGHRSSSGASLLLYSLCRYLLLCLRRRCHTASAAARTASPLPSQPRPSPPHSILRGLCHCLRRHL